METREPSALNESIDFNKLRLIIKKKLVWMILIFLLINTATYLVTRYSKDLYESHSIIKLDINTDASDLGIKTFADDRNLNIISGEIELIQSRLFLNRVLDSIKLDVSYFNSGEILNFEFFGSTPIVVEYKIENPALYNIPFYVTDEPNNEITVRAGQEGMEQRGRYGEKIKFPGIDLTIHSNPAFARDNLKCFFVINSRDVLLDYLSRNLLVEPLNFNANTIRISFKDHNPSKAHAIITEIDSLYLLYSNEQKNLANKQKIDWLTNELKQIEDKMGEYENYFENFILANKTNNLDEELRNTIVAINALDSQRYDVSKKLAETDRLADEINAGTFFISPLQREALPAGVSENLIKLQKIQEDLDKVRLTYSETTFAVKERQHTLAQTQGQVTSQLTELKNALMKRLQDLNQKKSKLEKDFALMPDRNTEFNKKQRFYKLYEQFYLSLMQSRSEFEIAKAGTTPDFKILSPASFSGASIAPNKLMILGIGFVTSVIFNFLFIGILYLLNNKITSINELERIHHIPVLGVIPESIDYKEEELHVQKHPKSRVSEAFRTLRTNLDFFNISQPIKVITISSTVSGEGKSFIAMNLGSVIALSKKKVILLDLDMRKPKPNLPEHMNDLSKGVSTILIRKNSWQECVAKTSLENFDFIPSGPHPPNPSELLLNGEFVTLLEELKQSYDFIILDTPPVGLVTDGIMSMKRSDLSIYVIRANYSKKEFLFNLTRITNLNKFSNITTLLNALPGSRNDKVYGYGYYEESGRKKSLKSIFRL